jgi:hypothetical protein
MAKKRKKKVKLSTGSPDKFYALVRNNKEAGFSSRTVRQADFDGERKKINRQRRKK